MKNFNAEARAKVTPPRMNLQGSYAQESCAAQTQWVQLAGLAQSRTGVFQIKPSHAHLGMVGRRIQRDWETSVPCWGRGIGNRHFVAPRLHQIFRTPAADRDHIQRTTHRRYLSAR